MRIVGGRLGGLRLAAVGKGDAGAQLRPTVDRVRESLFSILASKGYPQEGQAALDLFAGTGALGLEALSRGAGHVTFIEQGRVALGLLQSNIKRADPEGGATRLIRKDATKLGARPENLAAADLVLLDPPYGRGMGEKALLSASAGGWMAQEALVVWEENAPQLPPEGFTLVDQRRYGDTHITILRCGADKAVI